MISIFHNLVGTIKYHANICQLHYTDTPGVILHFFSTLYFEKNSGQLKKKLSGTIDVT